MPEPEVTGDYIIIRVKNPDLFQQDSFRTIDISKEQGIKATIGRLKGETTTTVQRYLFLKTKWTQAEAEAWVEEHKDKSLHYIENLYKEIDISGGEDKKIIKYYRTKILKIDSANHTAKVKITDEDIDRDKEINLLSSWEKHKKSYEKHPVLVSSHKYDNLLHQIGEAVNMDWVNMIFDFKWYAGEGNPEADWGWKLAEKGVAMFSVGYIPHTILEGDAIPEKYREKEPRRIFSENELLETSQVIVGSTRGALQLGVDNPSAEHYQYAYEVMKSFDSKILEFENVGTGQNESIIRCSYCKFEFDYLKEKEAGMGYVLCPSCKKPINQEGKGIKAEIIKDKITDDSLIISPIEIRNMAELQVIVDIYKSGRVISDKNKTIIKSAVEQMQRAIQALTILIEITEPTNNGGDNKEQTFGQEVTAFIQRNKNILKKEEKK